MLRPLLALAALALPAALLADRLLATARGGRRPEPLRMLEVVDAPIERTWAVVADIPLQPVWMTEMKEIRILTPGPAGVGTRGEATVRILGIGVRDTVEVVTFEPPRRYEIRHEGVFKGEGRLTLDPGADGTTTVVRWEEALIPPLLPHLAALVQGPVLRAVFQADLRRLKRLVESGGVD